MTKIFSKVNLFKNYVLLSPKRSQDFLKRNSSTYASKVNLDYISPYAKYLKGLFEEVSNVKHSALKSFNWPPLLYDELGGQTGLVGKRMMSIQEIIDQILQQEEEYNDITALIDEVDSKQDQDFISELRTEVSKAEDELFTSKSFLVDELVQDKELKHCEGAILEIRSGVGGEEAMAFAMELYDMYRLFCSSHGLEMIDVDSGSDDGGGLLKASCMISSPDGFAYAMLRHEAGIHRVQRVPKTETRGRLHTSTASVAVIPKHDVSSFVVDPNDIKTYFTASPGSGGQHVNKTMSCALVRHIPTGTQVRCHATRVQLENLNRALEQLRQILYKRMLEDDLSKTNSIRAQQTKSRARSDKIRTYNYPNNRITDHRIGVTIHGIDSFLNAGPSFLSLLNKLDDVYRNNEKVAIMNALFKEANIDVSA